MNRIRRTGTAPVGSGNTAGFAVEDSTGYLVVDASSDNNRAFRRKAVAPADSSVAFNVFSTRQRHTAAAVNAGATLLPAVKGFKYRLVDVALISIGGAAAGATNVRIRGVQAVAGVSLVDAAVAGLTQDTLLRAGAANAAILAGGLSFVANDANTAITIQKITNPLTGSTHIDVLLTFALEAA